MTSTVTRAEGDLLTVARVAAGVVPPGDALRLLVTPVTPPARLGPTSRELLADTLSRGLGLALARAGGWQTRLSHAPPLHFSPNTVRILSWLLATPLTETDVPPLRLPQPLTPAEDFLVAHLLSALTGTGCEPALQGQTVFREAPLTVTTHAALLSRRLRLDAAPALRLEVHGPWLSNMRSLLTSAWLDAELAKGEVAQVDELVRIGHGQTLALTALLDVAAAQRGLASFLIDVGIEFLREERTAESLTGSMRTDGPLRERQEARKLSGAVWRALGRLREWHGEHRTVRFFDDGYTQAQALAADWDRLGEPGFSRAAMLVAALDAL